MVLESNRDLVVRRLLGASGETGPAPGRRGDLARAGPDDSKAGRVRAAGGVLRDLRALRGTGDRPIASPSTGPWTGIGAFDTGLRGPGRRDPRRRGHRLTEVAVHVAVGRASVEGASQARATGAVGAEPGRSHGGPDRRRRSCRRGPTRIVRNCRRRRLWTRSIGSGRGARRTRRVGRPPPVTVESGESAETAAVGAAGGAAPVRLESHDRSAGSGSPPESRTPPRTMVSRQTGRSGSLAKAARARRDPRAGRRAIAGETGPPPGRTPTACRSLAWAVRTSPHAPVEAAH